MYRLCVISILFFLTGISHAISRDRLEVLVIDSVNKLPVQYAFVTIKNNPSTGILTDNDGKASIFTDRIADNDTIEVRMMGYETALSPILKNSTTIINLIPEGINLKEVTVRKNKEYYTKKNNPAVELIKRVRDIAHRYDPERNGDFCFQKYERITIGLDNIKLSDTLRQKNTYEFLKEFSDTIGTKSIPVLNVSLREKISSIQYSYDTKSYQEDILASRQEGIDAFLDQTSVQIYFNDIFREINLYNRDIAFLGNRFVGPLSPIGPDFYKYYLTDTLGSGESQIIELSFVPRTSTTLGFTGKFFIATGDSTFLIKEARLGIGKKANVNFVDHLDIIQKFHLDTSGNRIKVCDNLDVQLSLIQGTQGLYMKRHSSFSDYYFGTVPDFHDKTKQLKYSKLNDAPRDTSLWNSARPYELTSGEQKITDMLKTARRNHVFYWGEQIVKCLVNGYIPTSSVNSKFDFGPVNTLISGNSIEGVRLRVGGMTTAALSPHLFGRGYIAYGTKDKKLKYYGEIEYSFHAKKLHSREFPIHSLRVSHLYDVDMLGQHYAFTNADNIFLSWKRMKNLLMTYHRENKLTYTLETQQHLAVNTTVKHECQYATKYLPFKTLNGNLFNSYSELTLEIGLRFSPGEKFYQTRSERISINLDAPVFELRHTFGPKQFLGNRFTINRTEGSIQKRFWFSAFGHLDAVVKGGHVWSRTPYPSLIIPNANLSYTIQPESFALMNPMEFISDSYASAFLTYWGDGIIFNYIPLIKELKLREVLCCRGFYGTLSQKNIPSIDNNLYEFPSLALATPMHKTPYIEASVGIDNILKCIRIDYVWRVTYRNIPGTDSNGVRIAFHASF